MLNEIQQDANERMNKSITALENNFSKIVIMAFSTTATISFSQGDTFSVRESSALILATCEIGTIEP
jgi:hypothetical protein